MGPFIHFKMYKVVTFVLSFTVIAIYSFKLEANEPSTRKEGCIVPSWRGDNYCDDGNNNEGCDYDGGDCCGSNVNKTYCQNCECLDPKNGGTLILVVGGWDGGPKDYSQVIDMSTTESCSNLDPYPTKIWVATGGFVSGSPMICGGTTSSTFYTQSSCHKYERSSNKWTFVANMNSKRVSASSSLTNKGTWITGGRDELSNQLDTTEFISPDGIVSDGPKLPSPRSNHCMVTLHDGKVMIIGGIYQEKSTIVYNPDDNSFSSGPSVIQKRRESGCTIFRSAMHNNRNVVLVAGGMGQSTAEILDYTNLNANSWEEIGSLPIAFSNFFTGGRILPSLTGDGAYFQYKQYFFQLKCSSTSCSWTKMEQELTHPVIWATVMYLPYDYTCNN